MTTPTPREAADIVDRAGPDVAAWSAAVEVLQAHARISAPVDLAAQIERALFGCEDGTLLDDEDTSVPVGEYRRLLRETLVTPAQQGERAKALPEDSVRLRARLYATHKEGLTTRGHQVTAQVAPGCWVPARPLQSTGRGRWAQQRRCVRHCEHPAVGRYRVAYCCGCGRPARLRDRLMRR